MSSHFYLPLFLSFNSFLVAGSALSRRHPRLQRLFGVMGGLLIVAMGVTTPILFPEQVASALLRWTIIASGGALALAFALNWLAVTEPVPEDDAPLRPAANRPLRHFGDAS